MNAQKTALKERGHETPLSAASLALTAATGAEPPADISNRVGIERAFDVIRHHTVHTKGYVMTALTYIEEFGTASDKAQLASLLNQKESAQRSSPDSESAVKRSTKKK